MKDCREIKEKEERQLNFNWSFAEVKVAEVFGKFVESM
jgi:hypothetical protein